MLHVSYKPAAMEWGGYQAWPIKGFSVEWHNFVQQATPRQLTVSVFPHRVTRSGRTRPFPGSPAGTPNWISRRGGAPPRARRGSRRPPRRGQGADRARAAVSAWAMPITIERPADLLERAGQPIGVSGWHTVTQAEVDHFAEGTGNRAPIHTDPAFAATTRSARRSRSASRSWHMATFLLSDLWELRNVVNGADYGANKVRYPAAVKTGSRVRLHAGLAEPGASRRRCGPGDPRPRVRGRGGRSAGVRRADRLRVLVRGVGVALTATRSATRTGQAAITALGVAPGQGWQWTKRGGDRLPKRAGGTNSPSSTRPVRSPSGQAREFARGGGRRRSRGTADRRCSRAARGAGGRACGPGRAVPRADGSPGAVASSRSTRSPRRGATARCGSRRRRATTTRRRASPSRPASRRSRRRVGRRPLDGPVAARHESGGSVLDREVVEGPHHVGDQLRVWSRAPGRCPRLGGGSAAPRRGRSRCRSGRSTGSAGRAPRGRAEH